VHMREVVEKYKEECFLLIFEVVFKLIGLNIFLVFSLLGSIVLQMLIPVLKLVVSARDHY